MNSEINNHYAAVLATIPLKANAGLPAHIKQQELQKMLDELILKASQDHGRSSQLALEIILRTSKITEDIQRQYEQGL